MELERVLGRFGELCGLTPEEAEAQRELCAAALARVEEEQNGCPGGEEALCWYAAALACRRFVLRCIACGGTVAIGDPRSGPAGAREAAGALVEDCRLAAARWLEPGGFCFRQVPLAEGPGAGGGEAGTEPEDPGEGGEDAGTEESGQRAEMLRSLLTDGGGGEACFSGRLAAGFREGQAPPLQKTRGPAAAGVEAPDGSEENAGTEESGQRAEMLRDPMTDDCGEEACFSGRLAAGFREGQAPPLQKTHGPAATGTEAPDGSEENAGAEESAGAEGGKGGTV